MSIEHFNFVGNEEGIGPIVVSLRREKVPESYQQHFSHNQPTNERATSKYQYRIIVRTSEVMITCTMEPLYCGHHWDRSKCPDYIGVLISECPDYILLVV